MQAALIPGWALIACSACLLATNAIKPYYYASILKSLVHLMHTNEANGVKVGDQEFIWKSDCANDVYHLQKYTSRHKKVRTGLAKTRHEHTLWMWTAWGKIKKNKKKPMGNSCTLQQILRSLAATQWKAQSYTHSCSPQRNKSVERAGACVLFSDSEGTRSG